MPTNFDNNDTTDIIDSRGRGHGEAVRRFLDEDGLPQTVVTKSRGEVGFRRFKAPPERRCHAQWRAGIRARLEKQRALSEALRR